MTTPTGPSPWGVFGVLGSRIWRGYTRPSDPPITQVLGPREGAAVVASIFGQLGIGPRRPGGPGLPPVLGIAPPAPPLPGQPPPIILPGGTVLPPPSLPQRIIWGAAGRAGVWGAVAVEIWRRTPAKAKREIKRRGKKVLRGAYDKAKEYGPWVAILAGFEAWRDRRTRQGTMPADAGPSAADAPTAMPGGAPIRRPPRTPRTRGPRRGRGGVIPPSDRRGPGAIIAPLPSLPRAPALPASIPTPSQSQPTATARPSPATSAPASPIPQGRSSWPSSSTSPSGRRSTLPPVVRQALPFLIPLLLPSRSRGRSLTPSIGRMQAPALPGPSALPQMSYLTAFQGRAVGSRDCPPCEKKKRTGKRKTRTECFQGTYTEKASGLIKRKRKRVPCQ